MRSSVRPARAVFALNVRQARKARGLSQEGLAALAGVHRTYMGAVEREEVNISIDNMERIANALGVSLSALVASS